MANLKKMQERQALAVKIKEGSQIQREIQRNRKNIDNEIDAEMVQTFETYQAKYTNRLGKKDIMVMVYIYIFIYYRLRKGK